MRPVTPNRGFMPLTMFSLIFVALVLGTIFTVGSLWALGVDLPFFKKITPTVPPQGDRIPLSGRRIPPYTKITRDHFFNLKGEPQMAYLSPEERKKRGIINDLDELIGRVTRHEIPPGSAFRDINLFPKNTREGPEAGVAPGKLGYVLPADKVQGIHRLKLGDQFDLVATQTVDLEKQLSKLRGPGQPTVVGQDIGMPAKRADVKVLVRNGTIVLPVSTRDPVAGATDQGKKSQTKPVQEVMIAIEPDEVVPLSQALSLNAQITCVARSGRIDKGAADVTIKESTPAPRGHVMEVIIGSKERRTYVFPKPGEGPKIEPTTEESLVPEAVTVSGKFAGRAANGEQLGPRMK